MQYINLVFQLAGLAIVIDVLHTVAEQAGREEYSLLIVLGGIAVGLMMLLPAVANLFDSVKSVFLIY